MEALVQDVTSAIQPPWNYILAIIALLMTVGPKLTGLRREYLDIRGGRRQLELEKARLEVFKLRLEVEQLRKEHPAADLDALLPSPPPVMSKTESKEELRPRAPKWLENNPRLGNVLLLVTQGILGFFLVVCAVFTVVTPVASWNEPNLGPRTSIIALIIYGLFAWLFYFYLRKTRRLRRSLRVTN